MRYAMSCASAAIYLSCSILRNRRGEIAEPRVSTLRKLAAALGISTRDLLEE
jgi:transcriptional regulator with XRE-family HTH domain